ncbi:adipokinetic hormone/corazonin-related peptide-like [Lutzomyia longipalpis]|uniref:adipokinetic hormone/corazonin-related peptide-like n=1 Tax=Lutzomyia longipalpis TaxID=7200 RepID=UPI002483D727|nr:adipokinetic hormone/corazonin-related peptide-like [Lutzomyia longipalpis]
MVSQKSSLLPPNLSLMLAMLVVLGCVSSVFAQVTFSRDWNAGKRGFESVPSDCGATVRTIVTLCGAIAKNAHQLSMCEMKSILHGLHDDDASGSFLLHK